MNALTAAIDYHTAQIAHRSALLGRRVDVAQMPVLSREPYLDLRKPGLWSPNRSCRMLPTADAWIALNLAREEDRALMPAWLQLEEIAADHWPTIARRVRERTGAQLIGEGRVLGLPLARVGEVSATSLDPRLHAIGARRELQLERLRVLDLSSLWAGPLCGAVLAECGAEVTKLESVQRPDASRVGSPELYRQLNRKKQPVTLDFSTVAGRLQLREQIMNAHVVITSARRRAFEQLELDPFALCTARPGLIWVAITGYGWQGVNSDRVAFGDDAAAAGNLVRWTQAGTPRFVGDAAADPLTGLAAAAAVLSAVTQGGGVLIDAALAVCAAAAQSHAAHSIAA